MEPNPQPVIRPDADDVRARWRDSLARAAESAYRRASSDEIPTEARRMRWRIDARTASSVAFVLAIGAVIVWAVVGGGGAGTAIPMQDALEGSASPVPSYSMVEEEQAPVVVHVAGHVTAPGIVQLEAGQRVADAISAAGGALADADLSAVNLARVPADGEQILVPAVGEAAPGSDEPAGPLRLSTADAADLEELPGIGPVLAERIVADRDENGPFSSVEDLARVSGIGDSLVADLEGLVVP